jgi:hypothetical protein
MASSVMMITVFVKTGFFCYFRLTGNLALTTFC